MRTVKAGKHDEAPASASHTHTDPNSTLSTESTSAGHHNGRSIQGDRLVAIGLIALYVWLTLAAVYNRGEYYDTIAYALPGANLVARGALDVAQLGPQYGFDRFWLFNAPILVLGEVPLFLVFGIGRLQALAGIVVLAVVNLFVIAMVARRALQLHSSALALLIAFAFLGTRGVAMSDLYNQRYALLAFGCLALAFAPGRADDRRLTWQQWLAAGLLPLIHPTLALAAVVFPVVALWRRSVSVPGIVLFIVCFVASVAWYCRLEALTTQFIPHARYGGYRGGGAFIGLWDASASPVATVPTRALALLTAAGALAIVIVWIARPGRRHRLGPLLPSAALISVVLAIDAWHGLAYSAYYLIGLGPVLLTAVAPGLRRPAVLLLCALALANVGVALKLDREYPDWTSTAETRAFVAAHTRTADRVTLGPPFILIAATGVEGRSIHRVVPQPYFLSPFDDVAFVRDVSGGSDVYVGAEHWYYAPVWTQRSQSPGLFDRASIERTTFNREPIIVARKIAEQGP